MLQAIGLLKISHFAHKWNPITLKQQSLAINTSYGLLVKIYSVVYVLGLHLSSGVWIKKLKLRIKPLVGKRLLV